MMVERDMVSLWAHQRTDETWKDRAACSGEDPGLWFPAEDGKRHYDKAVRALTMTARTICGQCPVRIDCLQYAIKVDARWGMFGGLTEQERAKLTGKRAM